MFWDLPMEHTTFDSDVIISCVMVCHWGFKFNLISIPCRYRKVWNMCLVGNENLKSRTKLLSRCPIFSAHTWSLRTLLDVYLLFLHRHYGETHRRLPKYAMTIGGRHHSLVTLLSRSSLLCQWLVMYVLNCSVCPFFGYWWETPLIMDHWSPAWCRYKPIDSHVPKCVQSSFLYMLSFI